MRKSTFFLYVALLLAVSLLIGPKIVLIEYFSTRWIDTGLASVFHYLLQDLLLAAIILLIGCAVLPRHKYAFIPLSLCSGALLLVLLVDMRVRELWLKPLDWTLVRYSLDNASNLSSGADVFFRQWAGFGLTFRFIVFVFFLAWLASWALVAWANHGSEPQPARRRGHLLALSLLPCALLFGSISAGDTRYELNRNIFTSALVASVAGIEQLNAAQTEKLPGFEQPIHPLSNIDSLPRLEPRADGDFNNLIVIVLESTRWNSLFAPGIQTAEHYPTFARLASEGLLSKSYVTVPHSAKGYYSIFTGRHAYPGIEIKEAMQLEQPSIFHELKKRRDMQIVAFSSLFLQFENMEGFLKSVGVDKAYAVADMLGNGNQAQSSSFGYSDDLLFSSSLPYLKAIAGQHKGFSALYFPSAAHYPYDCSTAAAGQPALAKYEDCIRKTDGLIADMLKALDSSGLLDSTLVVLVGDHGESFGEHGLFIHNSSMYEEETTVPLIFWAKGRTFPKPSNSSSQQVDIAPTIADLFGLADSNVPVQGTSLLRAQGKRVYFMATFFDRLSSALVDAPAKYIYEYGADTLTRYDLEDDPHETRPQPVSGDEFTAIRNRILSYEAYQKNEFAKP